MQKNIVSPIKILFVIITEQISFIPDNILNCCEIIYMSRPSKNLYEKCIKKKLNDIPLQSITNIKILHMNNNENGVSLIMHPYKIISNKILQQIRNTDEFSFLKFRELLYDLLIYNINIHDCVWYIFSVLVEEKVIPREKIPEVLEITFLFYKYYNNNYRPIYHLELYFCSLGNLGTRNVLKPS